LVYDKKGKKSNNAKHIAVLSGRSAAVTAAVAAAAVSYPSGACPSMLLSI